MGDLSFRNDQDKKKAADNDGPVMSHAPNERAQQTGITQADLPQSMHTPIMMPSHPDIVDDAEVKWTHYVSAKPPGHPYRIYDVAVGANTPSAMGKNSKPEVQPQPQSHVARQESWAEFRKQSLMVDAQQHRVAPEYNTFFQAEKNDDLRALGFVMSSSEWKGNTAVLADQQRLTENGQPMGTLFRGEGRLNTTTTDQAGMAKAKTAMDSHGTAKREHDATNGADQDLRSKVSELRAALKLLDDAGAAVNVAAAKLDQLYARRAIESDHKKIEKIKANNEKILHLIERVAGGAAKFMAGGAEFDAVEFIGQTAGAVSADDLQQLRHALASHEEQLEDAETRELVAGVQSAKGKALAAIAGVDGKRSALRQSIGARKDCYARAGAASAKASGGNAATQNKITSMMAAIPVVEVVMHQLQTMVGTLQGRPHYSEAAGRGFGIATWNQMPQAENFVLALEQMEYCRIYFGDLLRDWQQRLSGLKAVRVQLGGARPGDSSPENATVDQSQHADHE
jgi:hypothetical protein